MWHWHSWLPHFGVNWAAMHYVSWLLFWLLIVATALYVGAMYVIDIAVHLGRRTDADGFFLPPAPSEAALKAKRMVNDWTPRLAMLVVGYVLGQAQLFSPVREYHNVEVLSKDADRVYTVRFLERGTVITVRLCAEGDDLPLVSGMVIEPFQFIQRRDCLLINGDTYVDWLRDNQRNVVDRNGRLLFAKGQ